MVGAWLEDTIVTATIRSKLASEAERLRSAHIGDSKRGNAAAAELHLDDGITITRGATSKPLPIPAPPTRKEGPDPNTGLGGHYQPLVHLGYERNVDSEFKLLSTLTDALLLRRVAGHLHLYTERMACASCYHVLSQFLERFPSVSVRFYSSKPGRWLGLRSIEASA